MIPLVGLAVPFHQPDVGRLRQHRADAPPVPLLAVRVPRAFLIQPPGDDARPVAVHVALERLPHESGGLVGRQSVA